MNIINKLIKLYNTKFRGIVYSDDSMPEGTLNSLLDVIDVKATKAQIRRFNKLMRTTRSKRN